MRARWRALAVATTFWPLLTAAPSAGSEFTGPPPPVGQELTPVETAQGAIDMLPRKPTGGIVLLDFDTDIRRDLRARYSTLDAFTLTGESRVYLNAGSELFARARRSAFYQRALAAVIWHEMAHLDGADEATAQHAEETLWKTYIRDELIERRGGLAYLNAMAKRRKG